MTATATRFAPGERCSRCRNAQRGFGRRTCDACYQRGKAPVLGPDRDMEAVIAQQGIDWLNRVERVYRTLGIRDLEPIGAVRDAVRREPLLIRQLAAARAGQGGEGKAA